MSNPLKNIKLWLPLLAAIFLLAGLWIGFVLANRGLHTPAREKLNTILSLIEDDYVDEISQDSLIEMTIPYLLENLDPHSAYVPVSELERANRDIESSFFGVGVQFRIFKDTIVVVEVVPGGPSEKAGLMAGDRIVKVDGEDFTGEDISTEKAFSALRGERDTSVELTILRPGESNMLDFTVVRGEIPSVSVNAAYLTPDSVGYIRVSKFARNTYEEFLQALNSLRVKGANSYIIDLRGNTGGLMEVAIFMSNEFLQLGDAIVETRGRHSADNRIWRADGLGNFTDQPVIVLIDEFSASSSEIFSGAIQDNDRGLVIGRRSFGKGLVQRLIELPDSSQMRLTIQRYYTPSGRCIQKPFTRGDNEDYESEILDRYTNGEIFNADSTKLDESVIFNTKAGRTVYGGGGIMPDVFVPTDTTGVTPYYLQVANNGLLNMFAFEYADLNRADLSQAKNVKELLDKLPPRTTLLSSFVYFAKENGVAFRPYYVNISANLIVNQLQAMIAQDILGSKAYFEIANERDPVVLEAVKQIKAGVDDAIKAGINNTEKQTNE